MRTWFLKLENCFHTYMIRVCLSHQDVNMQFETFKKLHGEDQMAVDKLKEGIDGFAKDQVKLETIIHEIVEGETQY